MGRRVLHVYYRQPRHRLRQAGMGWLTPFLDLPRAYALAGRFRASAVQMPYADWVREFDTLDERDRRQLRKRWPRLSQAEALPPGPGGERVQVVVPVVPATGPAALAATLASLGRQLITELRVVLLVAEGIRRAFTWPPRRCAIPAAPAMSAWRCLARGRVPAGACGCRPAACWQSTACSAGCMRQPATPRPS